MSNSLQLAEIFCDGMILQREQPIRLFGTGYGTITAELNGRKQQTEAKNNFWLLEFPALPAGGPYTIRFGLNGQPCVLNDVYIGDVWLAGGQSNMELPLQAAQYTENDLQANPLVRFYTATTENGGSRRWVVSGGEDTLAFSAIGGRFGRQMQEQHGIPVGIISCNRGATCIESWTDKIYLDGTPLMLSPEQRFRDALEYPYNNYGELYDLLVAPIAPFSLRGVLWYQGESNRGPHDGAIYGALLEKLIACWRDAFRNPTLPFFVVQLTRYGEPDNGELLWPLIRQQQLEACKRIPHTAMVTTTDLGESLQIHPIRKKEIADRLFLAAQKLVFGENTEYCGPLPQTASLQNGGLTVTFSHSGDLTAEGELADIYCRTADGRTIHTPAHIEGDRLRIPLPVGETVCEVLAWYRNDARVNLFNSSGFPASPFCLPVE